MGHVGLTEIKAQSLACYGQWAEQWRKHAKYHGDRFEMHDMLDFHQTGVGKAALLVANGASFEENLDTIKKYQDNVDVIACDKTLSHLLANGIVPKICILCDANVNYEKYCEPYADQ